MRIVTTTEAFFWKNRYSEVPVMAASVDPSWAAQLRTRKLPAHLATTLPEHLPNFPRAALQASPLAFTAALCFALHDERYGAPEVYGVTPDETAFWFALRDPGQAGYIAGEVANFVAWLTELATGDIEEFNTAFTKLQERAEAAALDQTIRAVLAECDRRGIPWRRLETTFRVVRLGQGHRQAWQMESLPGLDSGLAQRITRDKGASFRVLSEIALPVGRFAVAGTIEQAMQAAAVMGFPLVAKPNTGGKGTLVFVGLTSADQVRQAAEKILAFGTPVLLQSVFKGDDHRLLVVGGRLVAAARRNPASVVGDGVNSVEALVRTENRHPDRGPGFRKLMNYITLDDEVGRVLAGQGLRLTSIPMAGQRVFLRRTSNIHTGGTATDFTHTIHPDNRMLAERAARAIGLRVAGVDFLTPDITRSWREVGGGICEVNTTVGLRPHWLANRSQNVVAPIVDLAFPDGGTGRIPIALVTGSNGKTTTTRMLARILTAAGHRVGVATTDGVQVGDEWLLEGDVAGTRGAPVVLQEPTVTAAVLETARGGILQRGIYVEECDVAALLKVQPEQVGIDGIDTVEDMARVKRKVLDTARNGFVLNADDDMCRAMAGDFPRDKTILFSMDPASAFARVHREQGGRVVTLAESGGAEVLVRQDADGATDTVIGVAEIPATLGGRVRHNVENALAATALAWAMGIDRTVIAEGLRAFGADLGSSPGRFNLLDGFPAKVLLDYAHNPPALRQSMAALATLPREGRRVIVLTSPGNRPDDQIRDCGRAVAGNADFYVCMERLDRRRGRSEGEIARLLSEGLAESGVAADRIRLAVTQEQAVAVGAGLVREPDDLLAIFYTEFRPVLVQLKAAFAARATEPEVRMAATG